MKQSLTYIAFFLLLSVLLACEKQQNRHIQVYGTVRDSVGNPLTEILIEIKAHKRWTGNQFPVSSTRTKQDGTYKVDTYVPTNLGSPFIDITAIGWGPLGRLRGNAFIEKDDSLVVFDPYLVHLEFGKPKKVDFVLK